MQVSSVKSPATALERRAARAGLLRPVVTSVSSGFAIQLALVVSGVGAARLLGAENRGPIALIVLFPLAFTQFGSMGLPLATTYFIAPGAKPDARDLLHDPVSCRLQAVVLTALTAVAFLAVSHEVRGAAFLPRRRCRRSSANNWARYPSGPSPISLIQRAPHPRFVVGG